MNASANNDPTDEKVLITDIQDFAVHDGPGIRVLVFVKGCPLQCKWCQNPEAISPVPEIAFYPSLCQNCLRCLDACPVPGAITEDNAHRIDRNKCTACMKCVDVCLGKALRKVGEPISASAILDRIIRYRPFFDRSDGGLTLSGGEPLSTPKFSMQLLRACREIGIHTAVETCGFAPYETMKKIGQATDLILFDIKHMDEDSHQKGTGQSNQLILSNLEKFCKETDTEVACRIPLIPEFNDDIENIKETAEFVSALKRIKRLDILPFNELASSKYKIMGLKWSYNNTRQQPEAQLAERQKIIESYGLETAVGGLW